MLIGGWEDIKMTKARPWRTELGVIIGLVFGLLVWWSAYEPAAGLFQNP